MGGGSEVTKRVPNTSRNGFTWSSSVLGIDGVSVQQIDSHPLQWWGEVSPYRDEVESEADGVRAYSFNGAEVIMSSAGDVEISTEQLTVCESTGAAMSA